MKILAILLSPPVPATAGHRLRNRSLLRALALEGHQVTVLAYAAPEEIASPARELADLCHDFHLLPSPQNSLSGRLMAVLGSRPYGALRLTTHAMQSLVRDQLSAGGFDAILCDDCYLAGNVPADTHVPVVLNKHDITCRIMRQFASSDRNPLKRLYAAIEACKIQRIEAAACTSAQAVAVCSARDGELLREFVPAARMFVVPNAIDVAKYIPDYPANSAANDSFASPADSVLFVGAMDWMPNQDGADFLVRDILPTLRRLVPTAQVILAGRNPSQQMMDRYAEFPDVHFTGTVPDLRPVIARAAVCVVPLRIGSGTRLKILEAAAMAKPIVSTRLGAEGLDLVHGQQILLEDEPRAFAEAIAWLLTNPARASALGAAARIAAEQQYSIPALRTQLRQLLVSIEPARAGSSQP
jgi:glycosyltransferase involved in cell wall biosynthesis